MKAWSEQTISETGFPKMEWVFKYAASAYHDIEQRKAWPNLLQRHKLKHKPPKWTLTHSRLRRIHLRPQGQQIDSVQVTELTIISSPSVWWGADCYWSVWFGLAQGSWGGGWEGKSKSRGSHRDGWVGGGGVSRVATCVASDVQAWSQKCFLKSSAIVL